MAEPGSDAGRQHPLVGRLLLQRDAKGFLARQGQIFSWFPTETPTGAMAMVQWFGMQTGQPMNIDVIPVTQLNAPGYTLFMDQEQMHAHMQRAHDETNVRSGRQPGEGHKIGNPGAWAKGIFDNDCAVSAIQFIAEEIGCNVTHVEPDDVEGVRSRLRRKLPKIMQLLSTTGEFDYEILVLVAITMQLGAFVPADLFSAATKALNRCTHPYLYPETRDELRTALDTYRDGTSYLFAQTDLMELAEACRHDANDTAKEFAVWVG
jgi:hypothetical protein